MRNAKQVTRHKVVSAVQAVDRQLAREERKLTKIDPTSRAYTSQEGVVHVLRQKKARLMGGLGRGQ